MLQRVDADTFEADSDERIRLIAKATDNDGHEDARFRYVMMLPREQINGHPGATFDVVAGVKILSCVVDFAVGAAGARYDLFEVLDGSENDLGVSLTPQSTGTTVQFRVRGLAVPALAGAPRRSGPASSPRRRFREEPSGPDGSAKAKKKVAVGKRKTAKKTTKRTKRTKGTKGTKGTTVRKRPAGKSTPKRQTTKRKMSRVRSRKARVRKSTAPRTRRGAVRKRTRGSR